jgi:hypothetical protein
VQGKDGLRVRLQSKEVIMRVVSTIDFSILEDGKYRLNEVIIYHSIRYNKTVTVPAGFISDGATGANDISSRAWWVHDVLCADGAWDDGTKVSNWQCSTVLHDVLKEEGRWARALYWWPCTWLLGGGKARENGMFSAEGAK